VLHHIGPPVVVRVELEADPDTSFVHLALIAPAVAIRVEERFAQVVAVAPKRELEASVSICVEALA